jgi:hypothetical protein
MTREPPTICDTCNIPLTVKHLLSECPKYTAERNQNRIPAQISEILKDDEQSVQKVLTFLTQILLIDLI